MFTEEEINKMNVSIGRFMGYIYYEPFVTMDVGDFFKDFQDLPVYSKVPIQVKKYDSDPNDIQVYFDDLPNPDYKNTTKPSHEGWNRDLKTLPWNTLNAFQYVTAFYYHKDWNDLMAVIQKIEEIGETDYTANNNYHFKIGKRHTRVIYDWASWQLSGEEICRRPHQI